MINGETLIKVDNEEIKNGIYVIPLSVKRIGKFAFYNCVNLQNIIFHNEITNIEESAFYRCINLKEINFPPKI